MSLILASAVVAITSAHAMNGVAPVSTQTMAHAAARSAAVLALANPNYVARPGQARIVRTLSTNDPNHHANVNGRLWVSRPFIGPQPSQPRRNFETPGPLAYGVSENDRTTILVRVGLTSFGISPWQRLEGRANQRLENARLRWLNDHGYGSGVRTFVNDAYADSWHNTAHAAELRQLPDADVALSNSPSPVNARDIQPRATIRIPNDMPRFRKQMDVRRPYHDGILRRRAPKIEYATLTPCATTGRPEVRTVTGRANSWTPTLVVTRRVVARAD